MTNRWDFAPLAYVVGWRAFGWDTLSYPLQYRSTAQLQSDYEQDCVRAAADFESQWGEDLYSAFVTLGAAEARVYACGFAGAGNARKVRVHAAVRGGTGVVVVQDPGPDHHSGGTIHLAKVSTARLAQHVVDALPTTSKGRDSAFEIPVDAIDSDTDGDDGRPESWMEPTRKRRDSPGEALSRFAQQRRVGTGQIEVYAGPTTDSRDTGAGRDMFWVDVADDGRYLARQNHNMLKVEPVSAGGLADYLQRLVTNASQAHVVATADR